jgi:hypothetical protein
MNVLHGHDTPDTGHLTFCYPFGRTVKCVRREWIESADKGAKRGQQRFVTQTTHPTFNGQYSARIEADGQEAADSWARAQVRAGAVRWNKPNAGTYSILVVMVERPLDDGTGRVGVDHVALSPYAGVQQIKTFKDEVDEHLDDAQRLRLAPIERYATAAAAH